MPTRKIIALCAIFGALLLLYPGVTQPVLTLTGTIEKSELIRGAIDAFAGESDDNRRMLTMFSSMLGLDRIEGQVEAYNETRSILGTAEALWDGGDELVAFLVVLFSIVIPLTKLWMQLVYLVLPHELWQARIGRFIGAVSKWSMADVFLMSIIVAYLAGSAKGKMGQMLTLDAQLEVGFYWFLAYCLFSIASTLLIVRPEQRAASQS
ncbi:paraquat-inducible protein A [Biformimicrobium ophioploci]|uniref:Paraquat-inducible protein A n=1 Tax=Biformimicrobium ophioploci TaxID=3036711 RepID=A0ABQ6LY05_9GAMM|nr:paraquat-inducible protein A [Microbulbifer sp. NKW57]GMG86930.1 paraquat-inducible protein A [Microbulbifer sp. NKW57]